MDDVGRNYKMNDDNSAAVLVLEDDGLAAPPSQGMETGLCIRFKYKLPTVQNEELLHKASFGSNDADAKANGSPLKGEPIENEDGEDQQHIVPTDGFHMVDASKSSEGDRGEDEASMNADKSPTVQNEGLLHNASFVSKDIDAGARANDSPEEEELIENKDGENQQHVVPTDGFPMVDASKSSESDQRDDEASMKADEPQKTNENICNECGKSFPSVKSLHGHMRCHSTRGWRGMNPPPQGKIYLSSPYNRPSTSTNYNDHSSHRALHVVNWQTTARRGRKGTKCLYQVQSRTPEVIAACILLHMKHGSSLDIEGIVQKESAQSSSMKRSFGLDNSRIEKDEDSDSDGMDIGNNEHKETSNNPSVSKKKIKKKVEYLVEAHNTSLTMNDKKYLCISCNKCFSSHQALGGHRASCHNKGRNIILEKAELQEAMKEANLHAEEKVCSSGEHKCKTCNLTFSTGQALGGHMRRHWTAPENRAMLPLATSLESTKANRLEFDLNEMPMADGK